MPIYCHVLYLKWRSEDLLISRMYSGVEPVWAAGEVVQEQVQISAAKLQPGSYAVWMGMYAPVTQMRAAVKAGHGAVVDNRALLLEFQLAP